jgi:hypothetical protein
MPLIAGSFGLLVFLGGYLYLAASEHFVRQAITAESVDHKLDTLLTSMGLLLRRLVLKSGSSGKAGEAVGAELALEDQECAQLVSQLGGLNGKSAGAEGEGTATRKRQQQQQQRRHAQEEEEDHAVYESLQLAASAYGTQATISASAVFYNIATVGVDGGDT